MRWQIKALLGSVIFAVNCALWQFPNIFGDTPALHNVDTIVVLFALYGVSHVELLMLLGAISLERAARKLRLQTKDIEARLAAPALKRQSGEG